MLRLFPTASSVSFDMPVILFHQVNPDYEEDDQECQSSVSIGKSTILPLIEEGLHRPWYLIGQCISGPGFVASEDTKKLRMIF